MKVKTINAILGKKLSEWCGTLPEDLGKEVEKNAIITGGCIASMLLREPVNDYDVYFRKRETALAVAKHYVKEFIASRKDAKGIDIPIFVEDDGDRIKIVVKSAGVASDDDSGGEYDYFEGRPPEEAAAYIGEVMDDHAEIQDLHEDLEEKALENDDPYRAVFMSTNAITLSQKIQIITRFFGEPDEIHENYDFVHCTNYWTKKTGVVLREGTLESLLTKELRYVGSRYPVCSIIRTRKFIARGWTINAGQFVKMCFQTSQLDLTDIAVLEDQLTGVDVAYFHEVIKKLKDKDKETVESAYLIEIINRLF